MSLFRTLQHSPATVSIFHNSKVPLSASLYQILEKAEEKSGEQFRIDLMANKMPTYDQYQIITSTSLRTPNCRASLNKCYPFLHDQKAAEHPTKSVTVKGVEPTKIFTEGEYSIISEVFNHSIEGVDDGTESADPVHIFKAPLVVDWDQQLIASDEASLKAILDKYEKAA